jgi:hypothetical protein
MKKSILFIGAMIGFALVSKAQTPEGGTPPNPNAPEITFETTVIDYGTIEHNSNGDRMFKFKNTGKEPLIISEAHGSCGCTVPTAPTQQLFKPGDSGEIKVHYSTDRVGAFEKTVTVTSNAKNSPTIVRIKGVVKPAPATATTGSTGAAAPANVPVAPANNTAVMPGGQVVPKATPAAPKAPATSPK